MTKGRQARTVFINARLKAELQAYVAQARFVDRLYPLFASQKSVCVGFSANSLAQTFAHLYAGVGLDGASSHSGRRGFLTNLAEKGVSVRVMMALAGHRNMATTQRYIDLRPGVLRNAVELV